MSRQPATFITVFDVAPERQDELLDLLRRGADEVIAHRPGFVTLSLYASVDGRRVVNVAQWDSPDAARATQADPKAADYAARAAAIATPQPGVFTLAAEIH